MNGIVQMITGPKSNKAAERRQAQILAQQEAAQKRDAIRVNDQETKLSKEDASQRRAVNARRRGNQSLAYSGLKTTLGG
jgi:methylase of polypeptide subunit release factors